MFVHAQNLVALDSNEPRYNSRRGSARRCAPSRDPPLAAGGQFYHLASETLGYWTPSSLKILKTIASKTTTCNTTSLAQAFENLMQQLSVRLWTFNARMVHSLLQLR